MSKSSKKSDLRLKLKLSSATKESSFTKRPWTTEEDDLLREVISQHGSGNWSNIASHLMERTGKQCRERWHNHLNPGIKKGDWTEEEDRIILKMQKTIGNQWAKITKFLPGRTDNAVKNRYHATVRAKSRGLMGDDDTTVEEPQTPMSTTSEGSYVSQFAFNENMITGLKIAKTEKSGVDVTMRRAEPVAPFDGLGSPKRRGHQRSKSMPLPTQQLTQQLMNNPTTLPASDLMRSATINGKSVSFKRRNGSTDEVFADIRNITPDSASPSHDNLASASDDAFNRGIEVIAEPVGSSQPMCFSPLEAINLTIDEDYLDNWLDMGESPMQEEEQGCLEGLGNCELDSCCPMPMPFSWDPQAAVAKGQEKDPQCDFLPRMWKGQQSVPASMQMPLSKRADHLNGFGMNMFSYEGQDASSNMDDSIDHSYQECQKQAMGSMGQSGNVPQYAAVYANAQAYNPMTHVGLGSGAPAPSW